MADRAAMSPGSHALPASRPDRGLPLSSTRLSNGLRWLSGLRASKVNPQARFGLPPSSGAEALPSIQGKRQMIRRLPYIRPDEADRKIRGLENELFLAREAIIRLMTPEAQEILTSHYQCQTKEESWRWPELAADKVVALCGELDEDVYFQRRAKCPLCGEGSAAPGQEGFSLPIGLQRHLLGSHNARQCSVFGAAYAIAMGRFRDMFPWR